MENNKIPVIFIGGLSVGKTCIISRFISGEFGESLQTVGVSFTKKNVINSRGEDVELQIYDTAGQERYLESLTTFYFRDAKVAVVCFSYDKSEDDLRKEVDKYIAYVQNINKDCQIILAATKSDLYENEIPNINNFMNGFTHDNIIERIVTSSLDGIGIDDLFQAAASINLKNENTQEKIDLTKHEDNNNKTFCCK